MVVVEELLEAVAEGALGDGELLEVVAEVEEQHEEGEEGEVEAELPLNQPQH